MEGQITWRGEVKNYLLFIIKLENGVCGKTYVVKGFRNEVNWAHFKIGNCVGGLEWFDERKKILSADSPVYPLV